MRNIVVEGLTINVLWNGHVGFLISFNWVDLLLGSDVALHHFIYNSIDICIIIFWIFIILDSFVLLEIIKKKVTTLLLMNSVQAIKVEIVRKITLFEVLEFNYISCVNFIETMSQLTRWPFQIQKLFS